MKGTPMAGIEVALGVPPLILWLWMKATEMMARLDLDDHGAKT